RAFALRDAFPDVLGGLYLTEEFVAEPETEAQLAPHFETETPSVADAGVGRVEENQHQPPNGFRRGSFNNTSTDEAFSQQESAPQNVSVGSTQTWSGRATSRDEFTGSANEQPNPQTAATLVGLDGEPNARFEENGKFSETTVITGERELPITAKLPPLANLRRSRSMPRDVRALRFRNQWSVKQPRGPRKELSQTNAVSSDQGQSTSPEGQLGSSPSAGPSPVYAKAHSSPEQAFSSNRVASRRTSSLEIQRQSVPEHGVAPQTTTPSQGFIPADDITAHLDLFDAALCCATDPDTLAEIAEEFTERLSQLPRSSRNDAEQIFEKHQTRIGNTPTHGDRHD
ncbi:hypothetical protein KIH24_10950, partial [Rhizobiales bacterium TNE-4]|nr:hypothetical protein [Rhizobiales bacterium TNE-4]MBV1828134.1 hypothetical protein [Rhizobiales bacterium TNE-4]